MSVMIEEGAGNTSIDSALIEAEIDITGLWSNAGIGEVLRKMDEELVGLWHVKRRVRELAALLVVERARELAGLATVRPNVHMCFTGNPGTGKTSVAKRMGEILKGLGYLSSGHVVSVTRDDLVGQYIGHTAPKTREVLKRAMGGVLFIDEAYYLYRPENERDYGQEAIEVLLQVMEEERDKLVVILAGYEDRMDVFFRSNPGMRSRIGHHIRFPDYSVDELLEIGRSMATECGYALSGDALERLREIVKKEMASVEVFANGRAVRNMVERARLHQAMRLVESSRGLITASELVLLEGRDFESCQWDKG
jgi:probable Rubsico expression protein CbbX